VSQRACTRLSFTLQAAAHPAAFLFAAFEHFYCLGPEPIGPRALIFRMKLPNADQAVVPIEKLVAYLLDPGHPDQALPRFVTAYPAK